MPIEGRNMPEEKPLSDQYLELAYADDIEEKYANLYHVYGSQYELRLAFGNSKVSPGGEQVVGHFHTAIYLDYKLAKDMVAALQTLITSYEDLYGPAEVKNSS
jgi:hypothetical protein